MFLSWNFGLAVPLVVRVVPGASGCAGPGCRFGYEVHFHPVMGDRAPLCDGFLWSKINS